MSVSPHVPISLSAGAVATLLVSLFAPQLVPLRLLAFIILLSGYYGVLSWMGLEKPLNRLAAVFAAYGAIGQVMWLMLPDSPAGFAALYGFAMLAAFLVTSAAAVHRKGAMQKAGIVGLTGTALPLVALIVGHILLGGFGFIGIGAGAAAVSGESVIIWPIEAVLTLWALVVSGFLTLSGATRGENEH